MMMKRIQPAEFVKVILNGQVIHEHVKMTKGSSSGALKKKEVPRGPLMFQGGLGAVAFRNIKIAHERHGWKAANCPVITELG